jgi:hypothetical protein
MGVGVGIVVACFDGEGVVVEVWGGEMAAAGSTVVVVV